MVKKRNVGGTALTMIKKQKQVVRCPYYGQETETPMIWPPYNSQETNRRWYEVLIMVK